MKRFSQSLILLVLAFTAISIIFSQASAETINDVKARMKKRLPAIEVLKDQGIVGENNRGYLEFRKTSPADQPLVQAENADRKTVYTFIARQQNGPLSAVEKSGARSIAQHGKQGHWFQGDDGKWYRK